MNLVDKVDMESADEFLEVRDAHQVAETFMLPYKNLL